MSTPAVGISAEVTRQIRQHARGSMTTEVCGVLIGDVAGDDGKNSETHTTIAAAIPAVNAAQGGTHVTFTQDAWEHIYKVKDAEFPEARIVGWYHSHPGFGVFLSEHDTFIQQNFFSAPNQVAWVFDPHTDEEGCFGWIDGTIARLASITITDLSSSATSSTGEPRELALSAPTAAADEEPVPKRRRVRTGPPPRWLRWAASISALFAALLLGFTLSRLFFPALYPLVLPMNPITGEPFLRDPATGESVYMDPQTGRYLIMDRRTGKLSTVNPAAFKNALPSTDNPFPQPLPPQAPGKAPGTSPDQEKK